MWVVGRGGSNRTCLLRVQNNFNDMLPECIGWLRCERMTESREVEEIEIEVPETVFKVIHANQGI